MSFSSQVTKSEARASSQASNEDHSVFFPISINCEQVDSPAASVNKIVQEAKHPRKVEFKDLDNTLIPLEPVEQLRFDEIPRNDGKRYKNAASLAAYHSPSHTRGDDESQRTTALRIRAINEPMPQRQRPSPSDNCPRAKKPNRSSTLYKDLKRNDYYWY